MLPERDAFRTDIEGLRGVAILLVVAFHAGVSSLAGGYVGVDVFFVLSGYLITQMLAREAIATADIDFAEFYARRARRLLPALIVVLLTTLAIAMIMYAPIDRPSIATDARAVALHYGNVVFASGAVNYYATSDNPFLHTWSLAVEEQFYVVWPLLFALVGRVWSGDGDDATRKRLLIAIGLAGAASFAASVWLTRVAQPWAFFSMPTRIWEFAAGGGVALTLTRESPKAARVGATLQIAGLVALGASAFLLNDLTPYPGIAAMLPVAGTAALLIGGRRAPDSPIGRALSSPVLRFLGRVSYSWYLWHWPLVGLGAVVDWEVGVAGRIVWSLVALALAVLTLRVVEEPARRGDWWKASPQRINVAAFGASVAIAGVAGAALASASRSAASPSQRPFAQARNDGMIHKCWGSLLDNATAPCVFGDLRARETVVLFGDSHAEHWLPAMDRLARDRGWRVVAMIKPACPVADVPELVNTRLKRYYSECTTWRRAMLRRIVALRPTAAVLSSYDHYVSREGGADWKLSAAQWGAGLRRTYGTLARAGINTLVIRGTPRPGFDVPSCLSRRASGAPLSAKPCEYVFERSLVPDAVAEQNAAARGVATLAFVDMNDRVCDTAVCPVVRRGTIVFRDDGHLTATFSRREAPILSARIDAALTELRGRRGH
jgi:peptidoglycan/LPS O-acetylase OafA/YrhL